MKRMSCERIENAKKLSILLCLCSMIAATIATALKISLPLSLEGA